MPVYPVSGKVTYKGQPAVGALVVLHPLSPVREDVVAPSGRVNSDGSFQISVYEPGDGAPQGDYVATVQWFKMAGETAGPNVLPKEYANPRTSPIKVSVAGSPTEIPPVAIQ